MSSGTIRVTLQITRLRSFFIPTASTAEIPGRRISRSVIHLVRLWVIRIKTRLVIISRSFRTTPARTSPTPPHSTAKRISITSASRRLRRCPRLRQLSRRLRRRPHRRQLSLRLSRLIRPRTWLIFQLRSMARSIQTERLPLFISSMELRRTTAPARQLRITKAARRRTSLRMSAA